MVTQGSNKKINLVYDKWEDEKPLFNLSDDLGDGGFRDERYFFDFYERFFQEQLNYPRYFLPCTQNKIKDVYNNPNKKYYYGLKTSLSLEFIKRLPYDVIKCLQECKNFSILFIREHESEFYTDIEYITKFLDEIKVAHNKLIVLSNNPKIKEHKKLLNSNIQFHQLTLLSITSSSVFNELGSTYIPEKKGKFFVCQNKSPKPHRIATLSVLDRLGLLDDTNWSLLTPINMPVDDYRRYFGESDFEKQKDSLQKILDSKRKCGDYENESMITEEGDFIRDDFPHLEGAGGASGGLMIREGHDTHQNSYVNIITESLYDDKFDVIHITEKSFRPFFFYQIPIIVASHNHIKQMETEFGLDFYRDLVDHSYDDEKNELKRFKKISLEIERLYSIKDEVINYYKSNKERFEKNKRIIENLPNNISDLKFFNTLLS